MYEHSIEMQYKVIVFDIQKIELEAQSSANQFQSSTVVETSLRNPWITGLETYFNFQYRVAKGESFFL